MRFPNRIFSTVTWTGTLATVALALIMVPIGHADVIAMMEPVGSIAIDDDSVTVGFTTTHDRPAVYAWVVGHELIYIGKTGHG